MTHGPAATRARSHRGRALSPAAAIMLRSGVISSAFTCCTHPLRSARSSRSPAPALPHPVRGTPL